MEQKSLQHVTLQCKSAWLRTKPFRHSKPTYMYAKICIHATPQAPVSAQHELDIYITMILRRPLRTDADTDADPRGEVFGPRYDSHMLTLVGVYQIIPVIYSVFCVRCSKNIVFYSVLWPSPSPGFILATLKNYGFFMVLGLRKGSGTENWPS